MNLFVAVGVFGSFLQLTVYLLEQLLGFLRTPTQIILVHLLRLFNPHPTLGTPRESISCGFDEVHPGCAQCLQRTENPVCEDVPIHQQ
jgi:hypothetical protein